MLPSRLLYLSSIALFAMAGIAVPALAQDAPPPPPLPNYTLHQHVREVLTDVTVTDARGNPVTGLPQSAFHVYDDGHPQSIDSFVAHSGNDLAVEPTSTSGIYSNGYLKHPPAAFNIALLDLTTMPIVEQMVLRQRFIHFLKQLPPTEPLAIYMRNGPRIFLVQNFTTSRAALLNAVTRTIPRFRTTGYAYDSDLDVLQQLASYLSQYPGRKNLLWFNGGSNLYLLSDAQLAGYEVDPPDTGNTSMRALYDALESERIALYPIDVRGLTVSTDLSMADQQSLMQEEADTTGGQAFYNTNAIARSARKVLDHSADFYTLTYSPNDLTRRGLWHKVRITVDGPYRLSYRHGYFDDNPKSAKPLKPLKLAHGGQIQAPDLHSNPIVFKAEVQPGALPEPHPSFQHGHRRHPRGARPYTVSCALPLHDFPISSLNAHHSLVAIGIAVIVLDSHGEVVSHSARLIKLRVNTRELMAHDDASTLWQQPVYLPKGENNVYLALWNPNTGRLGTLQIPLTVQKR